MGGFPTSRLHTILPPLMEHFTSGIRFHLLLHVHCHAAWFLFLKGALKQALCGHPKEKVDAQVEETSGVETVDDRKGQVSNDEQAREETAPDESADSTNNLDLPDNEG